MTSDWMKWIALIPLVMLILGVVVWRTQRPLRRWMRRRHAERQDARAFAKRYGRDAYAEVQGRLAQEPDARMAKHLARVLRRLPSGPHRPEAAPDKVRRRTKA